MSCGRVFVVLLLLERILMKKMIYLLFAATVFVASCKKDPETPPPTPETPTAKVKFTNGTVNSGTLAIKINGTALADAQSLGFLTSTGYLKTTYGNNTTMSFVYPNTGSIFKEMTLNTSANASYSAFTGGELPTDISMIVISDDVTVPASGKAKVRFVNLSVDTFKNSFYVGGPELDSNIEYMGYTPFREVTAGSQTVLVQDPANPGYLQTINGQQFVAGKIYTIMLTGKTGGTGDATPKLTVINNN